MEAPEIQTEKVTEDLHEQAHHSGDRWISRVALSSAILAALAAITASLSGHHANEAMLKQIESSNQWAFYQAKGIKLAVLDSRLELMKVLDKPIDPAKEADKERYKAEQEKIKEEADGLVKESRHHLAQHQTLAISLAIFQVSIAVGAISALTRQRTFWYVSLAFGAVAAVFMVIGLGG